MAQRNADMGDMRIIAGKIQRAKELIASAPPGFVNAIRKISSKYNAENERECLTWIAQLTGAQLTPGMREVERQLRDGVVLCKLVQAVYQGTPNRPAACNRIKIKINNQQLAFKQMENITIFLNACEAYGVNKTGLFQTVDLYEGRNMAQVLNCILQLGSECQRHGFNGPVCGPRPTEKHYVTFTEDQLKAGNAIIGLQAGSNKGASQSGMSMGGVRHVGDIKSMEMSKDSHSVIGLQAGSNKGASQRGMNIGGVRHASNIEMSKEGQSIIGLQAGSNRGASQSGMCMGGQRHVADLKNLRMSQDSECVIGLQAGSNRGASQTGMSMGGVRHVSDLKVDKMAADSQSIIGLQAGSNRGASQSGIVYGGQRHAGDVPAGSMTQESQAYINLQMGTNTGASQSVGPSSVGSSLVDRNYRRGRTYVMPWAPVQSEVIPAAIIYEEQPEFKEGIKGIHGPGGIYWPTSKWEIPMEAQFSDF